jgi:hypothetical protein
MEKAVAAGLGKTAVGTGCQHVTSAGKCHVRLRTAPTATVAILHPATLPAVQLTSGADGMLMSCARIFS